MATVMLPAGLDAERQLCGAMRVRHEAEVADAVETVGQDMEEEPADELSRLQPHHLGRAAIVIVLPGEGDMGLVEGDEAGVGDGDAMGVAAEIGEHLGGAAEGLLGVNDPVDPPHGGETFGEGRRIGERRKFAEEAEVASCEGRRQPLEEQPPEQPRERLDRQKEVRTARDPARPIGREAAARDDAMEMGMMGQRLAPGVA